jgi:hypothetical protein
MRISEQLNHIAQAYGARAAVIANVVRSLIDARTDLVTVAVWAIGEHAGIGAAGRGAACIRWHRPAS